MRDGDLGGAGGVKVQEEGQAEWGSRRAGQGAKG